MNIEPRPQQAGDYKTGSLAGITADEITVRLGFAPNVDDDPVKVENSWGFAVDGARCAVWDWKGSHRAGRFSAFGPAAALRAVFGNHFAEA